MIGAGIVGAGFIGGFHAKAIAALEGIELVAANRRDASALDAFCAGTGCRPFTDYRALIADKSVDVVIVATPHHLHTGIVLDALSAGKAVFLEKPMATNLRECAEITEAVRAANATAMMGFVNRFAKAYQLAKEILDSGELGAVVQGTSTMSKFWMEPNRKAWHLAEETGGGMWLTAGIHCLDRLTWLIDSRIRKVTAQFGTRFHDQEADDFGTVLVSYESGAVGSVLSTGYSNGAPKHLTELVCTNGALSIDFTGGVWIGRNEAWEHAKDSGSQDWLAEAFVEQWRQFLPSLETGAASPVTVDYGFHIMEAAFAAMTSSRIDEPLVLSGVRQ